MYVFFDGSVVKFNLFSCPDDVCRMLMRHEVESVLNDDQYRPLELSTFKFVSGVNTTGREDISNGEFIHSAILKHD